MLPGTAQTLRKNAQDRLLSACGLEDGGQIHLCSLDWINPKNSDLCDLNSLCSFDLILAD